MRLKTNSSGHTPTHTHTHTHTQHNTIQYNKTQHSTTQHNISQYDTNTTAHRRTLHNITQRKHSTTQHKTQWCPSTWWNIIKQPIFSVIRLFTEKWRMRGMDNTSVGRCLFWGICFNMAKFAVKAAMLLFLQLATLLWSVLRLHRTKSEGRGTDQFCIFIYLLIYLFYVTLFYFICLVSSQWLPDLQPLSSWLFLCCVVFCVVLLLILSLLQAVEERTCLISQAVWGWEGLL